MFSANVIDMIEQDFAEAKPRLEGRGEALFSVFEEANKEEEICLKYIYSYLPLSDAASYDGSLYLKLVRDALAARDAFPWGATIPELIFLNYVLAVRVNNEDLTDHREIFRNELLPRLASMDMNQASLEVNVWCYEKATYQATDSRTVSPLTIIRRGFGRCGEESTFTVSALRSVAIPARQCYTPRWAHSDDNHAWVEVWIDGNWHYLGACEPEAVLDKGWFSAPARRGMLIESRVFSGLLGDEEVVKKGMGMILINVSDNYFPTARLNVRVLLGGKPLEGATVDFTVINYAEFTTLVSLTTDQDGSCFLKTGRGELFVRVKKGAYYIEEKVSLLDGDQDISLNFDRAVSRETKDFKITMHAPVAAAANEPSVSDAEEAAMNNKKAMAEQHRSAYLQTFMPQPDPEGDENRSNAWRTEKILADSMGNHEEIRRFLEEKESGLDADLKLDLLEAIKYKDLSDISTDILLHHAKAAAEFRDRYPQDVFKHHLLNARIGMEMISNWRSLADRYTAEQKARFCADPKEIWNYVNESIRDAGDYDYGTIMAEPVNLLDLGIGSKLSRRILTIALTRSLGIPARISTLDHQLEYFANDRWQRYSAVAKASADDLRSAKLILQKADIDQTIDYGTHFSLARLSDDATYDTLGLYREGFDTSGRLELALEAGQYQLLLCNRLASGDVLAKVSRFVLEDKAVKELHVLLPEDMSAEINLPAFHSLELEDGAYRADDGDRLLAILAPGGEPTEHFFNEVLSNEANISQLQAAITFVVSDELALENSKLNLIRGRFPQIDTKLPAEGVDLEAYVRESYDLYSLHNRQWPLLVVTNTEGDVRLAISGYQVGSVAQILGKIK